MTIDSLLKGREELTKEVDKLLSGTKIDAQMLARPLALQQSHVDSIGARITALETLRADQNARIDAQIVALKADRKQAETVLESTRKTLQPIFEAGKPPVVATGGTTAPRPTGIDVAKPVKAKARSAAKVTGTTRKKPAKGS
jgi:hypothetical protein